MCQQAGYSMKHFVNFVKEPASKSVHDIQIDCIGLRSEHPAHAPKMDKL